MFPVACGYVCGSVVMAFMTLPVDVGIGGVVEWSA